MQPWRPEPFRQRFMVLSAAVHAVPFVVLPWLVQSSHDVSPAPTHDPIGVSLEYYAGNPTNTLDVDQAWQRDGADVKPDTDVATRLTSQRQARAMNAEIPELLRESKVGTCDSLPRSPDSTPATRSAARLSQPGLERDSETAAPDSRSDGEAAHTYVAGALVNVGSGEADAEARHDAPTDKEQAQYLVDGARPSRDSLRQESKAEATDSNAWHVTELAMPEQTSPDDGQDLRGIHRQVSVLARGQRRQQQDREAAIRRIHERIKKVMPLVYWEPSRKNERVGRAVVRFRLTQVGYVADYELVCSSGDLEIDEAAHTVLHMAEPYVYVPGWIELPLTFRG